MEALKSQKTTRFVVRQGVRKNHEKKGTRLTEPKKRELLTSYSATWTRNARLLRCSSEAVSPSNFFTFSSFAGLYDRPSPFSYRKNLEPGLAPELRASLLSSVKRILRGWQNWIVMKFDELQLRSQFLFGGGLDLEAWIPPKNSSAEYETPFFYSFSNKKLNGPYLKAAEQVNLLQSCVDLSGVEVVCEIGAGFGALAETVIFNLKPRRYFIIDLPETLDISYGYLSAEATAGERGLFLRNFGRGEWRKSTIQIGETEISFLDATEPAFQSLTGIDLFLNSNSFAEMDSDTLGEYLHLVSKSPGAILLSANPLRTEGSSKFDPDGFASREPDWNLVSRAKQTAHSSFRRNVVTVHRV